MVQTTLDMLAHRYSEELHRSADAGLNPADSDQALIDALSRALGATGYTALREIEVEFNNGVAVFWGKVPTYHQKQLAQAVAQKVNGVRGIANGLEVVCRR
jgi:osmotically-inducible protein OsmY